MPAICLFADKNTVHFLSYRFDDEAGRVFCLAKAPESKNVEALHAESHGLIAIAIQDGFDSRTAGGDTPELSVGIGLAAGEPASTQQRHLRVGRQPGRPGMRCSRRRRHSRIRHGAPTGAENGFSFSGAGEHVLKGFADPNPVYELLRSGE
jgi:hypothetical protein